jgi:chromosome segregation ATPase
MTNQANRGIQGAVENLIEIAHMQRESIDRMADRMDAGFAKLAEAQTELTYTVNELGKKIDKLTDRADRIDDQLLTLSQNVNAQQVIAAQQATTVDKLVGLVTTLATKS